MSTPSSSDDLPILYITPGSSACDDAGTFLDEHGIGYRKVNVAERRAGRHEMEKISGQSRTPVLQWHGRVLADFDREELVAFLRSRDVKLEDS
jgi:glutaredoxin 3